jgi:hypothetical protein
VLLVGEGAIGCQEWLMAKEIGRSKAVVVL